MPGEHPKQTKTKAKRIGYIALNVWIVFHVLSIMITPMTVGASSQLSQRVWTLISPYPRMLYLAHGFHYFAPEPGFSTLLKYEATLKDGEVVSGTLPNRDISPRLLYHRHFMVTESLGGTDPEGRTTMVRAFANQLLNEHEAKEVSLTMVRHNLPTMPRVRVGGSLTEPDLYEEEFLGTFRWDESAPR
ncbi:MAG: hypothetical protein AB8G99_22340 [Planctomycetaceae bacterium]